MKDALSTTQDVVRCSAQAVIGGTLSERDWEANCLCRWQTEGVSGPLWDYTSVIFASSSCGQEKG